MSHEIDFAYYCCSCGKQFETLKETWEHVRATAAEEATDV